MAPTQAQLHLILGTDPRLLLEQAAAEFLIPRRATPDTPFPSPPVLLALRQGGIRDDLYALAHDRGVGGWYDPPLVTFQELPKRLGQTDRHPLTELERRALLGRLVRERATGLFSRLTHLERFLRAVDRLVGELVSEGVPPARFAEALADRVERDAFETARDAELAGIYAGYVEELDAAGRRDGRDRWADCALAVSADGARLAGALGGRRELRLFGLQDLRQGWQPLLRALRASPALDRITIYSAERLTLDPDLDVVVTQLTEPATTATRLFGPVASDGTATVQVIAAPDIERELEEVARRIRALADGGVPLHRMAVVSREARPHADLAIAALARFGVPATARRRHVLRDIPVVRALSTLFAAAAEGWTRHGLAELADQPYFAHEIEAGAINRIGYERRVVGLDQWAEAIGQTLVPELRRRFERFAADARALDGRRPLAAWIAWLDDFLVTDPWAIRLQATNAPVGRVDVARLDLAGWERLTELVRQWREAVEAWGGGGAELDVQAFHAQLDELFGEEVPLWTPTRRGVPVLEGFAAAYRSFEHLFVVGLEGGRFPLAAPGSPLYDEAERAALAAAGVPLELRAEWERRERELFRLLAAGARTSLTVSYARLDPVGREVVRSAFIEALGESARLVGAGDGEELPPSRVLTPGARIHAGAAALVQAGHAARMELDRETGRLGPWNGRIERPDLVGRLAEEFGDRKLWSPTQLEDYAKCPWAWFSSRLLGVAELADPDDAMDPRVRGTVLHQALKEFYEGEMQRRGGAVLLRDGDFAEARPRLVAALDAALAGMAAEGWVGHPALATARRADLERLLTQYLAFEIELNEKFWNNRSPRSRMVRTGVVEHEVEIREAVLTRNGVELRFRGFVDRVEESVDDRVVGRKFVAAVDYKSSKYAAPGGGHKKAWHDGVVLQGPLYAYALSRLRPGSEVSHVEYRALRQREVVHGLQLVAVDRKTRVVSVRAEDVAQYEGALDAAARHVQRLRRGEFPADPPPTCGCPSWCHARFICRVAGGLREPER